MWGAVRLIILVLILSLLFSVTSVIGYKASFVQIDRFTCKDKGLLTLDYHNAVYSEKFNLNTSKLFNKRFVKELMKSKSFNITYGPSNYQTDFYNKIWYELNNSKIILESEGDWYLLRTNLPDNVSFDSLEQEYYNNIQHNLDEVRYAMRYAISDAKDVDCIVGSGHRNALVNSHQSETWWLLAGVAA